MNAFKRDYSEKINYKILNILALINKTIKITKTLNSKEFSKNVKFLRKLLKEKPSGAMNYNKNDNGIWFLALKIWIVFRD